MGYLTIINWNKWQTYRTDRGQPPWIKIHRILLRNPEWQSMTDAQKGQLVSIWMLAADRNGEIPDNPKMIQKLCGLDSPPDLQLFISYGFIGRDAKVTPERRQGDRPDADADADADADKTSLCGSPIELPPVKIKVFDENVVRLANLLGNRMLENDSKARIPQTAKAEDRWLDSIDKLHRIDGRDWDEIESVVNWCQDDSFWKGNILSGAKLRKQFPQLLSKMKSKPAGTAFPSKHNVSDRNSEALRAVTERLNNDRTGERNISDGGDLRGADGGKAVDRISGGID